MAFSGRLPRLAKPRPCTSSAVAASGGLRLRKILRGDLAGQTGTERGSIGERLRPGHNVHAVSFGRMKQEGGRDADASSEGDPAIVPHEVDVTKIVNALCRLAQAIALARTKSWRLSAGLFCMPKCR